MNVAFISNSHTACGVAQFGRLMANALECFSANNVECFFFDDQYSLERERERERERILSSDLIFVNYHPMTMPFWEKSFMDAVKDRPVIGILHDWSFGQYDVYSQFFSLFRYRVCLDPTFVSQLPNFFATPRIIPDIKVTHLSNAEFTIGTTGFASFSKNYNTIFTSIEKYGVPAVIKYHIPYAHFGNKKELERVVTELQGYSSRLIRQSFSHDFIEMECLVKDFLAQNDLNFCCYKPVDTGGIASSPDLAIAAERPIAFSDSNMFRHIKFYAPELFLENSSLDKIMDIGAEKVCALKAMWSPQNAAARYDEIFEKVVSDWRKPQTGRYNTVLNDTLRDHYDPHVRELKYLCPIEFSRKISRANIQQAFVKAAVETFATSQDRVLVVGCYEDTAYLSLKKKGYRIEAIDPVLNRDLDEHFKYWDNTKPYHVIFSTSVIEHVPHDAEFVSQIAQMLAPGGYAIITMDFREEQQQNDPVIQGDYRFYTTKYILENIIPEIEGCELVDCYDWEQHPSDFELAGYKYAFASLVFRKKNDPNLLDEFNDDFRRILLRNRKALRCQAVSENNPSLKLRIRKKVGELLPSKTKKIIKKYLNI